MTWGAIPDIQIGRRREDTRRLKVDWRHTDRHVRAGRLVILVHGFRVGTSRAEDDYDSLLRTLQAIAPRLHDDARTLSWPGDVGPLDYHEAVVRAQGDVADALYEFVVHDAVCRRCELVFVCHSLGCRLLLETITRLHQAGRLDILARTSVFLMAAAIPVNIVESQACRDALSECRRADIFHSFSDWVLRWTFPVGERNVPGAPPGPAEAVGLKGRPRDGLWRKASKMSGYDHGAYWTSEVVPYRIALAFGEAERRPMERRQPARRLFGVRVMKARMLPARSMPVG